MMKVWCLVSIFVLSLGGHGVCAQFASFPDAVAIALQKAGDNADELEEAIGFFKGEKRDAVFFLIANMPERDLKSMTAEFLIDNVEYSFKALDEAPWRDEIPKEIFLNNILPPANVNERRDNWRADFYTKFKPLVKDCKTPAESAIALNKKIFKMLDVIFSRQRPKADQSPYETIDAGMASCTGLSILLVDACRAVGVPARFVGIPFWPDKSGNHSWVEIWDGEWHYTGAAEPRGDALDQAWFTEKARTANSEHPLQSIYAVSYKKTGIHFPLSWARSARYVAAVNVTDRYTQGAPHGEQANKRGGVSSNSDFEASMHAVRQLEEYLERRPQDSGEVYDQSFADVPLTAADAQKAAELLWRDYADRQKLERSGEMEERKLLIDNLEMPFFYSVKGEKPKLGRSLFISLHGGGGAPKVVNDQQWNNQKRLYKIEEGVYVAPRAPNDAWNMWFQGHIDAMFDRIIQNMILFEDVNPNRVYLMGYSAGGDGIYRMGPRMADRWAAVSMMAGHPGDASPLNLYNTPFTIHVGGKDAAYNRNEEARKWGDRLHELAAENPGGYEHWTKIYPDRGHWVDKGGAAAIPWMRKFTRDPLPRQLVWRQDKHERFFWLASDKLQPGAIIRARIAGQRIELESADAAGVLIRLNDKMAELDKPVSVFWNGEKAYEGVPERNMATIARTIAERGDPAAIFSAEIELP